MLKSRIKTTRVYLALLALLAVLLLLSGCAAQDVSSLEKLLVDLGVPPEAAGSMAGSLQEFAVEQADAVTRQVQAEAETLWEQIQAAVADFTLVLPLEARLALIVAGVILLLAGGRLYRAAVAVPGFVLGALIGYGVLNLAEELPDEIVLVVSLVIGLVGALLALAVHDLAVLLIGGAVAGFLAFSLLMTYNVALSTAFVLIVAVCAIAGAIGLVLVSRRARPLMAAVLGAALLSLGLVENLNLVVIVPAIVIGVGVQALARALRGRNLSGGRSQPKAAPAPAAAPPPPQQPQAYSPPPQQAYTQQPQPPAYTPPPMPVPPPAGLPPQAFPPLGGQPPTPPRGSTPVEWAPAPPYDQPTPPEEGIPSPPSGAAPAGAPSASQATLSVMVGGVAAQSVALAEVVVTIGSDPRCDLILPGLDPAHAVIQPSARGYYLRALGDPYRTRLNGQPARSAYLSDGDILTLGEHELRLRAPPAV